MLTTKVNGAAAYELETLKDATLLNGEAVQADWQPIGDNKYHVIYKDRSYTVELLGKDESGKQLSLLINGVKHQVETSDRYDALLKQLGMDKLAGKKMNDIKAPMPGLVLRIMVSEGQPIKKGDGLIVLEAMKMENVIKAAGEGVIKKIAVSEKTAVDKGQVLIVLE